MTEPIFVVTERFDRSGWYRQIESVHRKEIWLAYAAAVVEMAGDVKELEVLDAGCGAGGLAVELAIRGARVTALDIDFYQLFLTSLNAECHGVEAEYWLGPVDGALPKDHFDLIVASEVIEHVEHPLKALESLRKALKPGGRIILTVPHPNTEEKADHEKAAKEPHPVLCPSGRNWFNFDHLREWDENQTKRALETTGFILNEVRCVKGMDNHGHRHTSTVASATKPKND